jgi:tetratricopeptide (TPR) repeat protein
LSLQPENPTTHASKGWILVNQGKAKEAIERFRESLRMNPHSEWAYAGVVQAMKARNPIYYMLLCGSLSMSESSRGFRRTLYMICMVIPPLRALPLLIMFITFITDTAFTTLLRLDPLGRTVLQDKTRKANNYALIAIAGMIALIVWCCSIPPESHVILEKAQKLESQGQHAQAYKLIENSLGEAEELRKKETSGSSESTFQDTSRWLIQKNLFPDLAARAFNDLGFSYLQEKRYISAEAEFKNALATAKQVTDQTAYATALYGLAAALANENQTQDAAAKFEQSLSILKQIHYANSPLYREVSKNYANLLRARGDAKKADAIESSTL